MPIYIEHLINELLREHGGKLVSVMEPGIRAIVQAAADQERERCARLCDDLARDRNAIARGYAPYSPEWRDSDSMAKAAAYLAALIRGDAP